MIICHDVSLGDTLYLTAEDSWIAHIVPLTSRLGVLKAGKEAELRELHTNWNIASD